MYICIMYLTGSLRFKYPGPFISQKQQQIWNLTCKNIQSKSKKQNQKLPAIIEKIKFLISKKTVYGSFR